MPVPGPQLEHRPVQRLERAEHRVAFLRLLSQHGESAAQLAQHARDQLEGMRRLVQREFALDAPQQVGNDGEVAAGVEALAGFGEPRMRDDQRPGPEHEVLHRFGHALQVFALAQLHRGFDRDFAQDLHELYQLQGEAFGLGWAANRSSPGRQAPTRQQSAATTTFLDSVRGAFRGALGLVGA